MLLNHLQIMDTLWDPVLCCIATHNTQSMTSKDSLSKVILDCLSLRDLFSFKVSFTGGS